MIQIDIEMPEKCGLCPLFHAEHPMHCQGAKADRKKKIVAPYGQPRPDWCLLHEATADHDTVNRKQAIEAINSLFGFNIEEEYGSAVQEVINGLPSAQPRKGKWAGKGDSEGFGIFICDNCGKFAMMEFDFCPNCGADMREGDSE